MSDDVRAMSPDPALKQLDRFVGTWEMEGGLVGSAERNIRGRATYRWLPGGFFLEQRVRLDFAGLARIDSLEIIGYDPGTGTFPSTVYSNMSPQPLPYRWALDGDLVTITVTHGPLDATFTGRWSADGTYFSGGWRPNPGADEVVNVAYDVGGGRVE
ncbi:DUF1579 family protein [Saccharothrix syringae]|nr:DUF1579 family protein [Saccharothrix syringae]